MTYKKFTVRSTTEVVAGPVKHTAALSWVEGGILSEMENWLHYTFCFINNIW